MSEVTYGEPSDVTAQGGDVFVKGPGGMVVALTPDAAAETSDRLLTGAATAAGQRREEAQRRALFTKR